MEIRISLVALRRILATLIATVVLLGLGAELAYHQLDVDLDDGVEFFSLSYEQNLPTWFSSSMLVSCALLLTLIALGRQQEPRKAPYRAHWWVLAVTFFYISMDETVTLHENMNSWIDSSGFLYFGWVIPAGIFVAIFGLSFLGFLRHLPARTRRRFVLAGCLYVGGALGVELPLGWWTDRAGDDNLVYALIDLVEEGMEMSGAAVFLYGLLEYLTRKDGRVRLLVTPGASAPTR